ncbi:MAG: alpha/beta hydrolase [Gammaproteobacteria bacterium]|nr:MAG: alpha/beta hydrolase [Gammaproteobacteria bacterium]
MRFYKIILSVSIVLGGCDRADRVAGENSVPWLSQCPDFSKTGKAPVEQNAQCGSFDVNENPLDSKSKKISLNVLRIPAVNPVPEKDPLFVIAGGPGQSAVVVAETIHRAFSEIRKNRDILFVDQRGTGKSNPLDCDVEEDPLKQLPEDAQKIMMQEATRKCIEKHKMSAPFYTTNYAVIDIDEVRKALGYEKINLWGGSYGSRVVLEYMRRYPAHTRAGILDGAAPVAIALPWFMEVDALAGLQAINKQCAETPACMSHYGDIVEKAQRVSNQLLVKSQEIKIAHPRTQEKITVTLTAQDFSGVVRLALYNRDISSLLPQVISEAHAGEYELFASLSYLAKSKSEMSGISYGMHYTIACTEDYPLYKDKNASDTNVFLNSNIVQHYSEICAQWPHASLPTDYWDDIKSDIPTLVLSGAMDPVTPPRWGDLVARKLTNATHVVAPGGHHIITGDGCISQLIAAFIATGDGKNIDTKCALNIQPLAIHLPPSAIDLPKDASSHKDDIEKNSADQLGMKGTKP